MTPKDVVKAQNMNDPLDAGFVQLLRHQIDRMHVRELSDSLALEHLGALYIALDLAGFRPTGEMRTAEVDRFHAQVLVPVSEHERLSFIVMADRGPRPGSPWIHLSHGGDEGWLEVALLRDKADGGVDVCSPDGVRAEDGGDPEEVSLPQALALVRRLVP